MGTAINPIWLVILSVGMALLPLVAVLCTSYLKISIVLGMLRSGLGAQQVPGAVAVMGLALAISLYVMGPVIEQTKQEAQKLPWAKLSVSPSFATLQEFEPVLDPIRRFLTKHAGKRESQFIALSSTTGIDAGSTSTLLTAFMLTEIKEAFSMGFILLLPFLVIDLVVSNILVGMGMYMVSPVMIALPIKLLLFVVADGWLLITKSLIQSYLGV